MVLFGGNDLFSRQKTKKAHGKKIPLDKEGDYLFTIYKNKD
jgi:hypothetical protein